MGLVNLLDLEVNKVSKDINDYSLMITAPSGFGKAQPLSATILTKDGYKKMGDINLGDMIFGEDGKLHNVVGVFPQGIKDVYRVEFSDGTFAECCKDHIWSIQKPDDRYSNKFRNLTLEEIMKQDLYNSSRGYKRWNFYIPMVKPIEFEGRGVPIDPYILGLLIGDGYLASGNIEFINTENDIIEALKSKFEISKKRDISYRILDNDGIFKKTLNELGLRVTSEFKSVPNIYKYNNIETRLQILRGLIDTDGYVKNSSVEFSTASKQLAEDVVFLAQSLGCTAKIIVNENVFYTTGDGEKHRGKTKYRVLMKCSNDMEIFSSIKHKSRFIKGQTIARRTIRKIELVRREECQCIKTSNPSGLYLTNDFIVTHNTPLLAELYGDRALFLAFENSHKGLEGINAVHIDSYETLMHYVAQLENPLVREKFDIVVIDTLFLFDACIEKSVTDSYGKELLGDCLKWNKAYKIVDKKFLTVLKRIQRMNYTLAYVCHPQEKKIKLADGTESIKIEPMVSDRIKNLLIPEIDIRLFCHFDDKGNKVIYSQSTPFFDARVRVGNMEPVIPFSASILRQAFETGIDNKIDNKELLVDKLEQKNVVYGQERKFNEVVQEVMELGNELATLNLVNEANMIVASELGTDDDGNQRTLQNINEKMKPALEAIIVKLKDLKNKNS